ncbi:hypothetical protein, partial [Parabacteroides sp.]
IRDSASGKKEAPSQNVTVLLFYPIFHLVSPQTKYLSNKKNKPGKLLQIETSDKIFLSFSRSFAPASNHIMSLIPIFAKQIDAIIIYTQT